VLARGAVRRLNEHSPVAEIKDHVADVKAARLLVVGDILLLLLVIATITPPTFGYLNYVWG
jgi:hypothetical protein